MIRRTQQPASMTTRTGASMLQPFWSDLSDAWQCDHAADQCLDAPDTPAGSTIAVKHGPTVVLIATTRVYRA